MKNNVNTFSMIEKFCREHYNKYLLFNYYKEEILWNAYLIFPPARLLCRWKFSKKPQRK